MWQEFTRAKATIRLPAMNCGAWGTRPPAFSTGGYHCLPGFWEIFHLPKLARQLLFIMAATTLFLWLKVFQCNNYTSGQIVLGGLFLSGPLIYSVIPGPFLMHEFWAGTLIVLSLAIYAHGWRYTSALAGLAALFLRELALPFVFVMLILALIEGKRREALLWFVGIIVFGVEFFIHWSMSPRLLRKATKCCKVAGLLSVAGHLS